MPRDAARARSLAGGFGADGARSNLEPVAMPALRLHHQPKERGFRVTVCLSLLRWSAYPTRRSPPLGHRIFPGNICISLNDEIVHGIGSQRRIQYGDIVKLDIGVIEDGWVGDTAATVPIGMIDERVEKLLSVTESALQRAIALAYPGQRLGDLCTAIEDEA